MKKHPQTKITRALRVFAATSCLFTVIALCCHADDEKLSPRERELLEQWRGGTEATAEKAGRNPASRLRSSKSIAEELAEDRRRAEAAITPGIAPQVSPQDTVDGDKLKHTLDAARNGEAEAQFTVGRMYASGVEIPRDYDQAAYWFHRAATQGHTEAKASLGFLYASGRGVRKDLMQAHSLWSQAAAGGSSKAEFALLMAAQARTFIGRDGSVLARGAVFTRLPDRLLIVGEDGICCTDVQLKQLPDEVQESLGIELEGAATNRTWQSVKILEVKGQLDQWTRCSARVRGSGRAVEMLLANVPPATMRALEFPERVNQETAIRKLEVEIAAHRAQYVSAANSGTAEQLRKAHGNLVEKESQLAKMQQIHATDTRGELYIWAKYSGRKFQGMEIWDCSQ